jgi:hypothetical protein
MHMRVHDVDALYDSAFRHATEKDGLSPVEALELLQPDGEIDVCACLIMRFDPGNNPGIEIDQSFAEKNYDHA